MELITYKHNFFGNLNCVILDTGKSLFVISDVISNLNLGTNSSKIARKNLDETLIFSVDISNITNGNVGRGYPYRSMTDITGVKGLLGLCENKVMKSNYVKWLNEIILPDLKERLPKKQDEAGEHSVDSLLATIKNLKEYCEEKQEIIDTQEKHISTLENRLQRYQDTNSFLSDKIHEILSELRNLVNKY